MHELFDACLSPHISPSCSIRACFHCANRTSSRILRFPLLVLGSEKRYSENASDTVHRLFCRCRSPCAGLGTPLSGVRYHLPFPCGLHCPNCPLAHILQSHPKAECAAETEFPFSEHRYQSAFQIPHAESSRSGCGQIRNIPAYPEKSHWA